MFLTYKGCTTKEILKKYGGPVCEGLACLCLGCAYIDCVGGRHPLPEGGVMKSYWKCTTGFDSGPVLKGKPCYWVPKDLWNAAELSITPLRLDKNVPYDAELATQGLIKPCFLDQAAMDFSGENGPGLWPMVPLTEEELKIVLSDPDYNVFDLEF